MKIIQLLKGDGRGLEPDIEVAVVRTTHNQFVYVRAGHQVWVNKEDAVVIKDEYDPAVDPLSVKYQADGSDWELSLVKLAGQQIKDVVGYLTGEFGLDAPVFEITNIVLEDGTKIRVEGEHDCPYLTPYNTESIPNLSDEYLKEIYDGDSK